MGGIRVDTVGRGGVTVTCEDKFVLDEAVVRTVHKMALMHSNG